MFHNLPANDFGKAQLWQVATQSVKGPQRRKISDLLQSKSVYSREPHQHGEVQCRAAEGRFLLQLRGLECELLSFLITLCILPELLLWPAAPLLTHAAVNNEGKRVACFSVSKDLRYFMRKIKTRATKNRRGHVVLSYNSML